MNKSGALDAKNAFYVQWGKQKIVFISIPSFMMVFRFSFSTEFTPLFCISSVIWSAFLQGSFCYLILVVDQFHFGNCVLLHDENHAYCHVPCCRIDREWYIPNIDRKNRYYCIYSQDILKASQRQTELFKCSWDTK